MSLVLLLALQAAPSTALLPIEFDLARVPPANRCDAPGGNEILVCGRRPAEGYPMEKWDRIFRTKPLVAETSIGGRAIARAYGESVEMNQGNISKRIMVGIKLPF
jgi:hypothetical protein